MKSLQTILSESILSKNGPQMLEDDKLTYSIYTSLHKLPKANDAIYGRLLYDVTVSKKFNRPIINELKKLIKSDKLTERKVNAETDKPGIAIKFWSDGTAIIIAWDKDEYLLTRTEGLVLEDDEWHDYWTVIVEKRSGWGYLQEFLDVSDVKYYYVPCDVDMQLIKKMWNSKK